MTGIVDAHHHLWDVEARRYPWMDGAWADPIRRTFTTSDLEQIAGRAGVVASVLVQAAEEVDETRALLSAAADSAVVAGVVGWLDLTRPDVADVIATLREGRGGDLLVGVRAVAQDQPDPCWLGRPDVARGLRAVADAGLAYDLLVRPAQLPTVLRVVADHPGLAFVLDHIAKPPVATGEVEPWAGWIMALGRHPNVTCKVSGLVTEAGPRAWDATMFRPYVDRVVEAFGPDRLMFGSDWPVCLSVATYPDVLGLAEDLLAGLDRDAVFAGNARRAYRLPDPAGSEPAGTDQWARENDSRCDS